MEIVKPIKCFDFHIVKYLGVVYKWH